MEKIENCRHNTNIGREIKVFGNFKFTKSNLERTKEIWNT